MRATLLLIACLFSQCDGFRIREPITERVCKIAENPDDAIYGIGFSVDMPKCGDTSNCHFFVLRSKIAPKFIAEPVQSNAETKFGKCTCYPPGQDKALVHYIYTPREPCDIPNCWEKYNQFVSMVASSNNPDKNYRNHSKNGNHWKIGCGDGPASLEGLLTYKQLLAKLPEEQQEEVSKVAKRDGIVPQSPKHSEPKEIPNLVSMEPVQSDSKDNANLISDASGQHVDNMGEISLDEMPLAKQESIQLVNKVEDVVFNSSSVEEAQLHNLAYVTVVETDNEEERQAREQFLLKLEGTMDLLQRLQMKTERMMNAADGYLQNCMLMVEGNIQKAMEQNTSHYTLYLRGNIIAVAMELLANMEAFDAFDYATTFTSLSPQDLDKVLEDLLNTFALQGAASNDLEAGSSLLLQAATQVYHAIKAAHDQKDGYEAIAVVYGKQCAESTHNVLNAFQKVKNKMGQAISKLSAIKASFD